MTTQSGCFAIALLNRGARRASSLAATLVGLALLAACGGGGGGGNDPVGGGGTGTGGGGTGGGGTGTGGGTDTTVTSDDARRMVLADIGENVVLPGLRDFAEKAAALKTAVDAFAAAPGDSAALDDARTAWRAAMSSWQYNEVLQVGPAGLSSGLDATPGGADLRSYIYSFPFLDVCVVEQLAAGDVAVTAGSPVDTTGLGALEFLLFNTEANPCDVQTPPTDGQRAVYAVSASDRILAVADDLLNRWEPSGGDFLAAWRTAGDGSEVYSRPQDALDALSVALFYVEKDAKDDKIADPTGIGATDLTECPTVSCPERLESRLSRHSGENIRVNVEAFRDVFAGVEGGRGMNDLLTGIERDDLATEISDELQAVLDHFPNVVPDFDTAVEIIPNETECINATANPTTGGLPVCSLHGLLKLAMDTFRGPIVSALSLATPNRAAGDND